MVTTGDRPAAERAAVDAPQLRVSRHGDRLLVAFAGPWQTRVLDQVERPLSRLGSEGARTAVFDLHDVTALDTAGAWFIHRLQRSLTAAGLTVEIANAGEEETRLLATIAEHDQVDPPKAPRNRAALVFVNNLGRSVYVILGNCKELVNFLGLTIVVLLRSLLRPDRIRWRAVSAQMEASGVRALPIIGLISFLIGIVLAYQGADQLARFGAQIFTVNIVGFGVLREMGILLTAILVAGRSGSAYTAQIGAMQVNEEIDALKTLGLDPMEVLVMPRVIGLCLVLPLLAFYADIMGLLGGAIMASLQLGISIPQFITQLRDAVYIGDLLVGIIKAVPFAFIISMVGCFEGFRVSRSAESVGQATTRAVVEGVFLVIVLDALLSVLFQILGI